MTEVLLCCCSLDNGNLDFNLNKSVIYLQHFEKYINGECLLLIATLQLGIFESAHQPCAPLKGPIITRIDIYI